MSMPEKESVFCQISQRMTEAWGEMVKKGQHKNYHSLSEKRFQELSEGQEPKPGEEHIINYLRALADLKKLAP